MSTISEFICPCCLAPGECQHLMIVIEPETARAVGGPLCSSWNSRMSTLAIVERNEILAAVGWLADGAASSASRSKSGLAAKVAFYSSDSVPGEFEEQVFEVGQDSDEGDLCRFCLFANRPGEGTHCGHWIGWMWDGQYELPDDLNSIVARFLDFSTELEQTGTEIDEIFKRMDLGISDEGQIEFLVLQPYEGVLAHLGTLHGEGWSTNGMLSGSGCNLYVWDWEEQRRFIEPLKTRVDEMFRTLGSLS